MSPRNAVARIRSLRGLPRVTIHMHGDTDAERAYRSLTARYPYLPFIQLRRWGVALVPLPMSFADYLKGPAKQAVRTNRNRSIANGYTFKVISEPSMHLEDVMLIHSSSPSRQGRAMDDDYLDIAAVQRSLASMVFMCGVLDPDYHLRAYISVRTYGEVVILSRLMGHTDDLDKGVMWFLVSETIREIIDRRRAGIPIWCMYDMFVGIAPGLRYFKERLGFQPYNVTWKWVVR